MRRPLPQVGRGRVLVDWVTESLREAILQGYFEPGERLDQDSIAEDLEVSRTPVREAIRVLETEGFVEIRPHRGAYIATLTPRDVQEIYEVRSLLEAELVRQVTPHIPPSVLAQLERSLAEGEARWQVGDVQGHYESDVLFHETLYKFAENTLIRDILVGLTNRIARVRRFAQRQPGYHLDHSIREHRAILEAMRRRDPDGAAAAMRAHLMNSAERIQALIQ